MVWRNATPLCPNLKLAIKLVSPRRRVLSHELHSVPHCLLSGCGDAHRQRTTNPPHPEACALTYDGSNDFRFFWSKDERPNIFSLVKLNPFVILGQLRPIARRETETKCRHRAPSLFFMPWRCCVACHQSIPRPIKPPPQGHPRTSRHPPS